MVQTDNRESKIITFVDPELLELAEKLAEHSESLTNVEEWSRKLAEQLAEWND